MTEELHPLYLDLLKRVNTMYARGGQEVAQTPQGQKLVARLIDIAPHSYFVLLDARTPGSAAEMKAWSKDFLAREALADQERRDYPHFFELRREIDEAVEQFGTDAIHGNPQYAGLFVELMRAAPPRYWAIAEEVVEPPLPKAAHVTDKGQVVYSELELAASFGVPVERVHEFIEHMDPADLYRGPVLTLQ